MYNLAARSKCSQPIDHVEYGFLSASGSRATKAASVVKLPQKILSVPLLRNVGSTPSIVSKRALLAHDASSSSDDGVSMSLGTGSTK